MGKDASKKTAPLPTPPDDMVDRDLALSYTLLTAVVDDINAQLLGAVGFLVCDLNARGLLDESECGVSRFDLLSARMNLDLPTLPKLFGALREAEYRAAQLRLLTQRLPTPKGDKHDE